LPFQHGRLLHGPVAADPLPAVIMGAILPPKRVGRAGEHFDGERIVRGPG
jgi:hypothetical protein